MKSSKFLSIISVMSIITVWLIGILGLIDAIIHSDQSSQQKFSEEPEFTIIYDTEVNIEIFETETAQITLVEDPCDTETELEIETENITYIVEIEEYEDRYLSVARYMEENEITYETYEETTEEVVEIEEFQVFTTYTYQGKTRKLPLSEKTQEYVYKMSQKYDIPYRIILAILGVETHWNEDPDHVEEHNGQIYIGIGCLSDKWHTKKCADMGIDIKTLKGNIEALCMILRGHMDKFDNDPTLAAMAYNGGAKYAEDRIKQGLYSSGYTDKMNAYAESFK